MRIASRLERLERLQGILKDRETTTAAALAAELGVSLRSLWRDLAVLRQNGLPIEADRGRGGGIRLDRRWRLGRLNLDAEQAIDILLSLAMAEALRLPLLLESLRPVRQKLSAAFSDLQQARIRSLRRRILLGAPASARVRQSYASPDPASLREIKSAFFEMKRLRIDYIDESGRRTGREIEPQLLYLNVPVWYLLAWDLTRDDVRFFRIDRIHRAERRDLSFRIRDPQPFLAHAEVSAQAL
jgi:predicted DNA-binding transcriptional regulator YafY